jgi:GDP-L-fucose synthase
MDSFYKGKTVLITGGSGFVGMHFVQELLKRGSKVRTTHRLRRVVSEKEGAEVLRADLSQMADCMAVSRDIDYVVHCAGSVGAAGLDSYEQMESIVLNLVLASQMLQASWTSKVKKFLLFSSSTAYPVADYPIRENEMWIGYPHLSYFGYGWMRRYLERLGEFVAQKSDMKVIVVRPTAIYGRCDNSGHVIPTLIKRAVEKENPYVVWGSGKETRDFLHVTDFVRGSLLALEKLETFDPINIGYGKSARIRELVDIILEASGHKNATVEFDNSKPSSIPCRKVDISKAEYLLGFKPKVSLEEGIRDTIRWYKEQK